MAKRKKTSLENKLKQEIAQYSNKLYQKLYRELLQFQPLRHTSHLVSSDIQSEMIRQQAITRIHNMSQELRQKYDDYVQDQALVPWNRKNRDVIDFRDADIQKIATETNLYLQQHPELKPFACIPPFQSGILYTGIYQFYWDIVNTITKNGKTTVILQIALYARPKELQFLSYGIMEFSYDNNPENEGFLNPFQQLMDIDKYYQLTDIHNITNNKTLRTHWHELDMKMAKLQNMEYQKNIQKPLKQFAFHIIGINMLLHMSKPTVIRKNSDTERKLKIKLDPHTGNEPIKRIREIQGIRILSEKSPEITTKELIRHYHLENWTVRGHIRHYKNGKTVYIKPTIHHRKALKGVQTAPVQTILHVQE